MGGGFLLQGTIASEGEGALAEAVHGVRLLAVSEQGLSGYGYIFGDMANGDVEELAYFQHVGELGGCEYEVAAI
jgi:hypothetical protein